MKVRMKKTLVLAAAAAAMLAVASTALACPVCFGESNDPIVKGAQASVLFMVVLTYVLLASGVVTFLLLRRRARRLAEQGADSTFNP